MKIIGIQGQKYYGYHLHWNERLSVYLRCAILSLVVFSCMALLMVKDGPSTRQERKGESGQETQ